MRNTLITLTIIAVFAVLVVVGNVFLVRNQLADARAKITAATSFMVIDKKIMVNPKFPECLAFIKKPTLFPLGTWVMRYDGTISWVSNDELRSMMVLQ
jgi:hypothetical protein